MVTQVIINKTGNEIVAMVIARLYAYLQWVVGTNTGLFKASRFQFFTQELIIGSLVYQDRQLFIDRAYQLGGIPLPPKVTVFAQVMTKGLVSPG